MFFTLAAVFTLLFLLGGWLSYALVESSLKGRLDEYLGKSVHGMRQSIVDAARLASRSYLQALAERGLAVVNQLHTRSAAGELSEDQARSEALRRLAEMKVGRSGYIYVVNSEGIILSHPSREIAGRALTAEAFIREQIKRRQGFLQYEWKNPGENAPRRKILYMEYFPPWDWIVSVSAYVDELPRLVNSDDFGELASSLEMLAEGALLLLDGEGRVLLHPGITADRLEASAIPARLREQAKAEAKGRFTVSGTNPQTTASGRHLVAFERIEEMDWLVAATVDVEAFYRPLTLLRNLYLTLLVVVVGVSLVVSYTLSKHITAPFMELLNTLMHKSAMLPPRPEGSAADDEIGQISKYVADYVGALEHSNTRLEELVEEQRRNALDLSIYKQVFDNIVEGIAITDADGAIVRINPAFERITGYGPDEAVGQNPRLLKSDRHPPTFYREMWQTISEQGFWSGKIWNRRKNGEVYPEWLTINAVRDRGGRIRYYAAVFNDITELAAQQEKIHFLAYHDHLTELPNRIMVRDRLEKLISECRRSKETVICLICDIADFKGVNDSMGQEGGDLLLQRFVTRIRPLVRLEDTFGRVGGDEFVLLTKSAQANVETALRITGRITAACTAPFQVNQQDVYVDINVGIALFPDDADSAEELIKRAFMALSSAEKSIGENCRFYDQKMEQEAVSRMNYLARIRDGLQNSEFIPFYQPKVNLASGRVTGMEALARWQSEGELVPPNAFIPVAEESGLIIDMAGQLYEKAFAQTVSLHERGHLLKLALNLSPVQLYGENFLDTFVQLQRQSGLPAEYVELEITESVLFENIDATRGIIEALTGAGFTISIDDFGTGYSSLQYLKQIAFDTLKIDMSFVQGIGSDRDDEQLVRTIALLAKQFGMQIVAEGVETEEQIGFLRLLGCDYGQGYYYSRPLPFEEFSDWLEQRQG